jgi:hypothetical protein
MSKNLLTLRQLEEITQLPDSRLCDLARQGILPVVRFGRQIQIDPDAFEEFKRSGGKSLPGGWRRDAL